MTADAMPVPIDAGGGDTIVAEVTAAAVADLDLVPGAHVWASVKAVDLTVYER